MSVSGVLKRVSGRERVRVMIFLSVASFILRRHRRHLERLEGGQIKKDYADHGHNRGTQTQTDTHTSEKTRDIRDF